MFAFDILCGTGISRCAPHTGAVDGVNDVGGAVFFLRGTFLCASFRLWTEVDQLGLAFKKMEFRAKGADLMKLPGSSRGLQTPIVQGFEESFCGRYRLCVVVSKMDE